MNTSYRIEKEARIRELREAIAKLEAELEKDMEAEQHEMLDQLEDYFNVVETKLSCLKVFWQALKRDLTFRKSD